MFRSDVPPQLRAGPFSVADALGAGLARNDLRARCWRRVRRGYYVWAGIPQEPDLELDAVTRTLPTDAVFSGLTAAWLHGLELGPGKPLEVTLPNGIGISGRAALRIRRVIWPPPHVVAHGFRVTTIERTLFDLARCIKLPDLVAAIDQALHHGMTTLPKLDLITGECARRPGSAVFRTALDMSDGAAESPMESRLRVLLLRARLPKPQSQVSLFDSSSAFLGRVDLYYAPARLAIEYDGDVHRAQLDRDLRRQNRLLQAGFTLLRYTSSDIRERPAALVAQVRSALRSR